MFIVSVYFKVAFALLCVALLFELIGFASPYWMSYSAYDTNMGLWQSCSDYGIHRRGGDRCNSFTAPSSIKAARAFSAIALILLVVLVILLLLYWCQCPRSDLILASIILCFVAAACAFIGIICWVTYSDSNLSWAFFLCVIAGILAIVAGILLIPERRIIIIGRTTTSSGGASTVRTVTTTRTVTVR